MDVKGQLSIDQVIYMLISMDTPVELLSFPLPYSFSAFHSLIATIYLYSIVTVQYPHSVSKLGCYHPHQSCIVTCCSTKLLKWKKRINVDDTPVNR